MTKDDILKTYHKIHETWVSGGGTGHIGHLNIPSDFTTEVCDHLDTLDSADSVFAFLKDLVVHEPKFISNVVQALNVALSTKLTFQLTMWWMAGYKNGVCDAEILPAIKAVRAMSKKIKEAEDKADVRDA